MEHMSTTNGIAIHHSDDRLRETTDLHLHIEHRETRNALFIHIATTTLDMHITTRAESVLHICQCLTLRHLTHGSSQQHHTDVLHLSAHRESLTQLPSSLRSKGIAILRTINRDLSDTIVLFEQNLLKLSNLFPISIHNILFFVFDRRTLFLTEEHKNIIFAQPYVLMFLCLKIDNNLCIR